MGVGGLGRGNWFSIVQPPLVQALRTRGRFIYCTYRVLCWAIICGQMHCDCSMHPKESCLQMRACCVVVVPVDV